MRLAVGVLVVALSVTRGSAYAPSGTCDENCVTTRLATLATELAAGAGGHWPNDCHTDEVSGLECDCPSVPSSGQTEYWNAPHLWICTLRQTSTDTTQGFALRKMQGSSAEKTFDGMKYIHGVRTDLTPFASGISSFRKTTLDYSPWPSPTGCTAGTGCATGCTASSCTSTAVYDTCSGSSGATGYDADCMKDMKGMNFTQTNGNKAAAWTRVLMKDPKDIKLGSGTTQMNIAFTVLRLAACDNTHKCPNGAASCTNAVSSLDGIGERTGSICASKKSVVNCNVAQSGGGETACKAQELSVAGLYG